MKTHSIEQRSPEWYSLRLGMPTSSEFSKVVTSTGIPSKSVETYALTLAGQVFAGKSLDEWDGNKWTERGREFEDNAKRLYEFTTDVDVETVGFVTDDKEIIGCSPDGLVGQDGMVEFKCLKAERHISAILYHKKHDQCPPGYIQQTQGQIMICHRDWCDLVFYHPDLPLLIIRQTVLGIVAKGLVSGLASLLARRDEVVRTLREFS